MEPELAVEAVELTQAAPGAGAENEKEREKSALLERMDGTESGEESAEVAEGEGGGSEDAASADEEAQRAEARRQARQALEREFPEALVQGSELAEACREELAYLREARSPLADDPQAEYKIARRMARVMGLGRTPVAAAAPQEVQASKPVAAPARRSVRPMPTGGAPVESPATALERRVAGAKSTGDMLELMREIGTPFEALLKR